MANGKQISVFNAVDSEFCVSSGDGQKLYDMIAPAIAQNQNITISFDKVTTLTSAFLNSAIGQLYGNFERDKIRALIKIDDMQPDDLGLLKRVVDAALKFFKKSKQPQAPETTEPEYINDE